MRRLHILVPALFPLIGCANEPARRPLPPTPGTTSSLAASSISPTPRTPPPLTFEGLGPRKRTVTTKSAEAQRYFDQGLAFMAAFNHDEAERAFLYAAELDPSCAMAHWGVAMANGPHINNPEVDATHAKAAWAALGRARAASKGASKLEQGLIDAITKRYTDPQPADRAGLEKAYADAMKALHEQYPDDVDVAGWFAEALMDLRPWDYWTTEGKPQPGTEDIVRLLEETMTKDPNLPLALHLYIHIIEASPMPEKADAAADRLRDLAPGLGHLVHMPSHIDIRRGRWGQAVTTNEKAIAADSDYTKRSPKQGFYNFYMGHTRHMLSFAAMMLGQSEKALTAIREMVAKVDPAWAQENALIADGMLAMPVEVLMRFGRWEEILAVPEPAAHFPLSRTLRRYARGVAYSAQDELDKARAEQTAMLEERKKIPKNAKVGNATAIAIAGIAESVLAGEIAIRENNTADAVAHLREAVKREDALLYDEPPDWIQPVRHALGATLIRAGKAKDAEAVYREDLKRNPENGWSLFGLERAFAAGFSTPRRRTCRGRSHWREHSTLTHTSVPDAKRVSRCTPSSATKTASAACSPPSSRTPCGTSEDFVRNAATHVAPLNRVTVRIPLALLPLYTHHCRRLATVMTRRTNAWRVPHSRGDPDPPVLPASERHDEFVDPRRALLFAVRPFAGILEAPLGLLRCLRGGRSRGPQGRHVENRLRVARQGRALSFSNRADYGLALLQDLVLAGSAGAGHFSLALLTRKSALSQQRHFASGFRHLDDANFAVRRTRDK